MAISENFETANQHAKELRAGVPKAVAAHYDRKDGRIVIRLSSQLDVSFSPHDAQGLENAKPSQLEEIEISPSGFGIRFPKLDADIYLPGLLEAFSDPGSGWRLCSVELGANPEAQPSKRLPKRMESSADDRRRPVAR